MAVTTRPAGDRPVDPSAATSRPGPVSRPVNKAKPIKWWAGLGALCIAFELYLFTRWILSGSFEPVSAGPDPNPAHMKATVMGLQVLGFPLLFVCIYAFIIRPWRRDRKVGLLGLLIPAILSMYWQDLVANYFNPVYTYNGAFWNRGSWYEFIPGFRTPNAGRMIEPIFFSFPAYVWSMLIPGIVMAAIMRKVKTRWPQLGTIGILAAGFAIFAPFLMLLEQFFVRTGAYVYAGSIKQFTLFSDHYYQYPIYYEFFLFGILGMCWAAIVYFRNDRGDSMVESGIHDIQAKEWQKYGLRTLALSGYMNLTFMLGFNLPMILISLMPGFTWTHDLDHRSYLRMELCGAGTTVACPTSDLPIPSRGGVRVGVDGKLVVPPGSDIPTGGE